MKSVLLVALLMAVAAPVFARPPWELITSVGYASVTETRGRYAHDGVAFSCAAIQQLTPVIGAGVGLTYARWGLHYTQLAISYPYDANGSHNELHLGGVIRAYQPGHYLYSLFAHGAAMYRTSLDSRHLDYHDRRYAGRDEFVLTANGLAFELGAGLRLSLSDRTRVELLPCYHYLATDENDPSFITVTIGCSYTL